MQTPCGMFGQVLAALIVMWSCIVPSSAWADSEPHGKGLTVAVLPFVAVEQRMGMYGKPVADAVARELSAQLRDSPGVLIQAIALTDELPGRVSLVIDGRIVSASPRGLVLEAQVRDPEHGRRLAVVASDSGKLTDIDRLARALGEGLAVSIREIANSSSAASPEETRPVQTASESTQSTDVSSPQAVVRTAVKRNHVREPRPAMVVFQASGRAAGGTIEVADVATDALVQLVRSLGYRPVRSAAQGIVAPAEASAEMQRLGASRGLMFDMRDVSFSWLGVLAARGHFRAVVIERDGRRRYDRTQRTDTLVGSRGDRHRAVVRFVVSQASMILRADMVRWKLSARARSKP